MKKYIKKQKLNYMNAYKFIRRCIENFYIFKRPTHNGTTGSSVISLLEGAILLLPLWHLE